MLYRQLWGVVACSPDPLPLQVRALEALAPQRLAQGLLVKRLGRTLRSQRTTGRLQLSFPDGRAPAETGTRR